MQELVGYGLLMTDVKISDEQRRARLGRRHLLAADGPGAATGSSVADVAEHLVALHSTDPASVFLSVFARLPGSGPADVERALYDDRSVVRMLGMRRTVFVVPRDVAPIVQAAAARAIGARERIMTIRILTEAGTVEDPAQWLTDVEKSTVDAVAVRGEATGSQLSTDEPRLRTRIHLAQGKAYAASVNVTTRVLLGLAAAGHIVRGRPRGSWISSQYHWSPMERWFPGGLPELSTEDASEALVRRWLGAFGPGTQKDIRWWTGWTAGQVNKALARIQPVEVSLESGGTGLVLPDDVAPVRAPKPWAALLPALDPTPMGWVERDWFLGPHAGALFDRSGNIGPTIWWRGRIVGGWAQRPDGEILLRFLEDVGHDAVTAVDRVAERLASAIGPTRFRSRFPTPLEKQLLAT